MLNNLGAVAVVDEASTNKFSKEVKVLFAVVMVVALVVPQLCPVVQFVPSPILTLTV